MPQAIRRADTKVGLPGESLTVWVVWELCGKAGEKNSTTLPVP